MRFIDEHRDRFAVALLLRVLGIAESTYYQWVRAAEQPSDDEGRRVERQHVSQRWQEQRARSDRRPPAQLSAVAADDEPKGRHQAPGVSVGCRRHKLFVPSNLARGPERKGPSPRSGDGP